MYSKRYYILKNSDCRKTSRATKAVEKEFRNVSIITALNAQKDRINELGSIQFAAETGQTLTHFTPLTGLAVVQMQQKSGQKVEGPKNLPNMSPIK